MTDRVRVFISSTFNDFKLEREYISMVCESMSLEVKMFPEQASPGTRTEYLEELIKSHILVLLVPTRLSEPVEEEIRVARANGIPLIPFFKFVSTRNRGGREISKRAEQFKRQHGAEFGFQYESLRDLESGFRSGISWILHKRFSSPIVFKAWGPDVYEQARRFISFAGTRFGFCQQTSTLVLGPRFDRLLQEQSFHQEVLGVLKRIINGERHMEFLHVFSRSLTLDAWSNQADQYPQSRTAVDQLRSIETQIRSNKHVKIVATDHDVNAAIVGDASFQMAVVYGSRYYTWVREFGTGANELWRILDGMTSNDIPLGDFLTQLQ